MKKLVITLFLLTALVTPMRSFCQGESSISGSTSATQYKGFKALELGVGYQVHSMPLTGSQLIGPDLGFQISPRQAVGGRYLVSPEFSRDQRVAVYWQLRVGGPRLYWLIEPQMSYLTTQRNNSAFFTSAVSTGLKYRLSSQFLMGGLFGLEQIGPVFPVGPIWNRPQVLLFTQFDF